MLHNHAIQMKNMIIKHSLSEWDSLGFLCVLLSRSDKKRNWERKTWEWNKHSLLYGRRMKKWLFKEKQM